MRKAFFLHKVYRFTQWSRKPYATFNSLGKCVTIGRVKWHIAEVSLKKEKGVLHSESTMADLTAAAYKVDFGDKAFLPIGGLLCSYLPKMEARGVDDLSKQLFTNELQQLEKCNTMHFSSFLYIV